MSSSKRIHVYLPDAHKLSCSSPVFLTCPSDTSTIMRSNSECSKKPTTGCGNHKRNDQLERTSVSSEKDIETSRMNTESPGRAQIQTSSARIRKMAHSEPSLAEQGKADVKFPSLDRKLR